MEDRENCQVLQSHALFSEICLFQCNIIMKVQFLVLVCFAKCTFYLLLDDNRFHLEPNWIFLLRQKDVHY